MGLLKKVTKGVTGAAINAGSSASRTAALKKAEMELADLTNRYDECYLIIGKRISEFLRNGDEIEDSRVQEAFSRITKFDANKAELENKIRELKGEADLTTEAKKLAELEEEVEKEISKCKELLEMGVDTQDDYDRKVATFQNKINNFKQLDAIEQAFKKKLISKEEYLSKKSTILGQDVSS